MFVELPILGTFGDRPLTLQITQIARYSTYVAPESDGWTELVDVQGNKFRIHMPYEEVKEKIHSAMQWA